MAEAVSAPAEFENDLDGSVFENEREGNAVEVALVDIEEAVGM